MNMTITGPGLPSVDGPLLEGRGSSGDAGGATTLKDAPPWLREALGYIGGASSKASITPRTSLQVTAVYAAVRYIAESIAKLPIEILEVQQDGSKRRFTNHVVATLFATRLNPEMTNFTLFQTVLAQAALWGNGYAEIVRGPGGTIRAVYPIESAYVIPFRRPSSGELMYRVADARGRQVTLLRRDLLHFPALGWDGTEGLSPIRLHRGAIGVSKAAETFGVNFFDNSAKPSGILKHPATLSDTAYAHLRESWAAQYQGVDNAGKPIIAEEGLEWTPFTIPPSDAQFIEVREFGVVDIARIFRVPPHKIGHLKEATFSNIEHQSIEAVTDTLGPWLALTEQELGWKLIGPSNRGRLCPTWRVDELLRGDMAARSVFYHNALIDGWMVRDDVRSREGLSPYPDGRGSIPYVPINTLPAPTPEEAAAWVDKVVSAPANTGGGGGGGGGGSQT